MAVLVTLKANSGPLIVDLAVPPLLLAYVGPDPVERVYLGSTLVTDI